MKPIDLRIAWQALPTHAQSNAFKQASIEYRSIQELKSLHHRNQDQSQKIGKVLDTRMVSLQGLEMKMQPRSDIAIPKYEPKKPLKLKKNETLIYTPRGKKFYLENQHESGLYFLV